MNGNCIDAPNTASLEEKEDSFQLCVSCVK